MGYIVPMMSPYKCLNFLIILFFGTSAYLYGQQEEIDSLKLLVSASKPDTTNAKLLYTISRRFTWLNADSADYYVERSLQLSHENQFGKGLALAYNQKGIVRFAQGRVEEAFIWLDSALVTYRAIDVIEGELFVINNIGAIYQRLGDIESSIKIFREGLDRASKTDHYASIADLTNNIGNHYYFQTELDSALHYYRISLDNHKKDTTHNGREGEALMLSNIGNIYLDRARYYKAYEYYHQAIAYADSIEYVRAVNLAGFNMALLYEALGDYQRSIDWITPVLEYYRDNGLKRDEPDALHHIARCYRKLGQIEKSLEYATAALQQKKDINSTRIAETYNELALLQIEKGSKRLGLFYANEALSYAQDQEQKLEMSKALNLLGEDLIRKGRPYEAKGRLLEGLELLDDEDVPAYKHALLVNLAKANKDLGQFAEGMEYLEQAMILQDSINERDNSNALIRSTIQFETEKKELNLFLEKEKVKSLTSELALASSTNKRNWVLVLFALSVLGFIGYRRISNSNKRKKEAQRELQQVKLSEENERLKAIALERELELRDKRLVSQALVIAEKNEILNHFKEELNQSMGAISSDQVNKTLKSLEMNQKNWEGFRTSFEAVHESFFDKLAESHADLTPHELQLCALFRLNLSMKEASGLLGISVETVKKARYRIRKKFGLNHSEQNLTTYLMAF